jgi:ATP-binding cassette subfamily F protein uup
VKARRTKQASRVDWIEELRKEAVHIKEKKIKIEVGADFITSRVIEAHSISKSLGGKLLFDDFTYFAKPKDRIGIIGPNGSGKSTLLKVLQNLQAPDEGTVKIGTSIKIGYFKQEVDDLKPEMSVLGAVKEIGEYIKTGIGKERFLTAQNLLDKFKFPRVQHKALIRTLSGGEKRRLALIRLLMGNPNVLLLDEPTNDFDLETLTALEEYLDNFYGVLISISHDRAFLDRTVNFIYAFDGKGHIKQYPGNYSFYLEKKEEEKRKKATGNSEKKAKAKSASDKPQKKLSYMDQREYDNLEKLIPELEEKKEAMEEELHKIDPGDYKLIQEKSEELQKLTDEIDEASMRWLELAEKVEGYA